MRKQSVNQMQLQLNALEDLKKEYQQKGDSLRVNIISGKINDLYSELQAEKRKI